MSSPSTSSVDLETLFNKSYNLDTPYSAYKFPRDPDLHFFLGCSNFQTPRFTLETLTYRTLFKNYFCTTGRFSSYLYLDAPSLSQPLCQPCLNKLIHQLLPEPDLDSLVHIVNSLLELPNNQALFLQNKAHYLNTQDFEMLSNILGLYESTRYKVALYEDALDRAKSTLALFSTGLRKTIQQEKLFLDKTHRYLLKHQPQFELEELTYYLQTQLLDSKENTPLNLDELVLIFGSNPYKDSLLDNLYQTWLTSLTLTPLERKAKFFAYVDSLHTINGLGKASWLAQRDQILTRKLNLFEKALAHIKAEPPQLFFIHEQIMNLSYYSRPLTSLNLYYQNYTSSLKTQLLLGLPSRHLQP